MEQHPLVGGGGSALDPPAMVDGAQAEAAGEGTLVMEEHPVEGTGGRPPDPPAMVDGALAEAAWDITLIEGVGNGDQAGNGGQLEAPAPAKPKSRYVHPI